MGTLDGKIALVTGAGQGVGQGIAFALSAEGAAIAVSGRTASKLETTCKAIEERGGRAIPVACNVKSEASLTARPLALSPRTDQIFLEFVHQSPDRTDVALRQASRLFRNTPELQLRLGAEAADQGDYQLAVKLWRGAATLDPKMVTRVLGRAIRFANFPLTDLIPDSPEAERKAKEFLDVHGATLH